MSRIRLNQEYRNKIATRMRVHLEQEPTQEKTKYDSLKADQLELNDKAWSVAEKIVRRHYTPEDVKMAYYLQNKFDNVNTIAKDSCFHFHYLGEKETRDYDNNLKIEQDVPIEKHFDFRLNGDIDVENNSSHSSDYEYGYALFRDELKAQEKCNPDILIEQDGKDQNPHLTKYTDANNKYLGNDDNGYGKEWNEKYKLDLIGREYCRDRTLLCSKEEFNFLITWKQAKGQFVMAHYKWIKSILKQMKFVKEVIKSYKYLDEALEFAHESDLKIDEAEIIRSNSSGLILYNPKNASEHLKAMKNQNKSQADKIRERILYEKNAQSKVVN
jgi:predicted DsbA family dithiol-disulfide isomerase